MPLFQEILTFSSLNFVPTDKHRRINKPYMLFDRKNLYIPVWSSAGTGPILQHRTTSTGIAGEIKHGIVFEQNRKLIILLSIEHNDKHSLALIDGFNGDLLQSFEVSYGIIYMTLVNEANGMFATILTCGIDRKIHRYTIDNKCTIRRSKKKSSNWFYRLLSHHMIAYDPLTVDVLPMRILVKDHLLVIGYSNGLLDWIMLEPPQTPRHPTEILSEIPAFRGIHSSESINIGITGNITSSPSRTDNKMALKRCKSDSILVHMASNSMEMSRTRTSSEKEELSTSSTLTTAPLPLELTKSKLIISDETILEEEDDEDEDDEDDDEEQDKVIFDDIQQVSEKKGEEILGNNPEGEDTLNPAVEAVIPLPAPILKKLLFDGAICAMSFYRLPYQIDGLIVAMASGAVAIVSLSSNNEWSLEQPLAILPGENSVVLCEEKLASYLSINPYLT